MTEPTNYEEYTERCTRNTRYEGFGLDTRMISPCPFCGAPDFMNTKILEVEKALADGATCKECQRSAKALITSSPGSTQFEIVQTGGPDAPDWLTFKPRRITP